MKEPLETTDLTTHNNSPTQAEAQIVETDEKASLLSFQQVFQGPIPHPDILRGYEKVAKGSANRIISMAEKEAAHRHYIEERAAKDESRDSLLGIIAAVIISVAILICGTVIVIKVPSVGGVISGSLLNLAGLATIASTFLINTRSSKHEDEEK